MYGFPLVGFNPKAARSSPLTNSSVSAYTTFTCVFPSCKQVLSNLIEFPDPTKKIGADWQPAFSSSTETQQFDSVLMSLQSLPSEHCPSQTTPSRSSQLKPTLNASQSPSGSGFPTQGSSPSKTPSPSTSSVGSTGWHNPPPDEVETQE